MQLQRCRTCDTRPGWTDNGCHRFSVLARRVLRRSSAVRPGVRPRSSEVFRGRPPPARRPAGLLLSGGWARFLPINAFVKHLLLSAKYNPEYGL